MSGLNCPVCKTVLQERNMHDVTIDECPQCRGIWLDRGELQKILGGLRADFDGYAPQRPVAVPRPAAPQPMRFDDDDDDDHYRRQPQAYAQGYAQAYGGGYPKRKKSMVENLFDMFD